MAADRYGLLARRVAERVAERDQVQEVIGMQVADQDRVDVDVVAMAAQLGEDTVAAVKEQREVALLDQISAACPGGVLPGWLLAQHRNLHGSPLRSSRRLTM
jgi:hypothetical protein